MITLETMHCITLLNVVKRFT